MKNKTIYEVLRIKDLWKRTLGFIIKFTRKYVKCIEAVSVPRIMYKALCYFEFKYIKNTLFLTVILQSKLC